ncbi:MAG TPA: lasso peptide biosynthesis B2 protein [Candidatus Acidoferrum sp.]|nr:lasso peptide biosynthesis B2 protein [Candidatus Acidoferrum sp.]
MLERLRRFKELPAPARRIFLRAAVLLPWVALRLRLQGFKATKSSLQSFLKNNSQSISPETSSLVQLTARMVRAAARHGIGNPSCLEESLVLLHLLNEQGIAAQLRIGVKKNIPQFEAHAWVECDGKPLNESEALHDHYAPFEAEFSGPAANS